MTATVSTNGLLRGGRAPSSRCVPRRKEASPDDYESSCRRRRQVARAMYAHGVVRDPFGHRWLISGASSGLASAKATSVMSRCGWRMSAV